MCVCLCCKVMLTLLKMSIPVKMLLHYDQDQSCHAVFSSEWDDFHFRSPIFPRWLSSVKSISGASSLCFFFFICFFFFKGSNLVTGFAKNVLLPCKQAEMFQTWISLFFSASPSFSNLTHTHTQTHFTKYLFNFRLLVLLCKF